MGKSTNYSADNTNINTDSSTQIGFDSIDGGTAVNAGGNVSLVFTDQGAVNAGVDLARDSLDAIRAGTSEAIGGIVTSQRGAFNFGADALDFAGEAAAGGYSLAKTALTINRDNLKDTLDFADARANASAAAVTRATDQAFNFAQDAARRESAGYQSAVDAITRESRDARGALVDTFGASFDQFGETVDSAFDAVDRRTGEAFSALTGIVTRVTSATTDAISAQANATRSETSQGFETLIKYGTLAAVALGAVMLMRR